MLVSHRCKFIYTKTVKTGGTSVEAFFERYCMADDAWSASHAREEIVCAEGIIGRRGKIDLAVCRWWNHMPAALLRQQIGEEVWRSYYKFCVVRNPFEKAVSAFFFKKRKGAIALDASQSEPEQFEQWLASEGPMLDHEQYLIDGAFCLDGVIRHERMDADMAAVCARLGIPWVKEALPTFKSGIRPREATVASMYSARARSIVEQACAVELTQFGYAFPCEA